MANKFIRKFIIFTLLILLFSFGIYLSYAKSSVYAPYTPIKSEEGCYIYKTDEDIINAAKIEIIKKLGEEVLASQKQITIIHKDFTAEDGSKLIILSGKSHGHIERLYYSIFNKEYIPTVGIIFNEQNKCLYVKSVMYQKD